AERARIAQREHACRAAQRKPAENRTGQGRLLPIMRRLTLLSKGRHSELYALDPGRVVKLFRAGYAPQAIETELQHARRAHELGVPTPRPEGIIETQGRRGIVFERVEGPTVFDAIGAGETPPPRLAELFFGLQRAINALPGAGLPDLKERVALKVCHANAAEALKREALAELASLPPGESACHGDFHPANVIMAARGPMVVDWLDAGRGDAALDAARTLLLLRYARSGGIAAGLRAAFVAAYVDCLREAWRGRTGPIERWQRPLAVARLAEAVDETECNNLLKLLSTTRAPSPS
ncbi:MAG TPA: aminoglycoside phosphotransferase family protein, partial [Anaeromyxobacteraceae bacterium]|nr:aminoglycoside phosphotransferase family protein [Anaeromyxobacteraceae bacterium]